jgi:hypothetical protein
LTVGTGFFGTSAGRIDSGLFLSSSKSDDLK